MGTSRRGKIQEIDTLIEASEHFFTYTTCFLLITFVLYAL